MTRILTEGFEMGDDKILSVKESYCEVGGAYKRSGVYGLRVYHEREVAFDISARSEIYMRIPFYRWESTNRMNIRWQNGSTVLGKAYFQIPELMLTGYVGGSNVISAPISSTGWTVLELHIKLDNVAGKIEAKADGVLVFSYEGDTMPSATNTINRIAIEAAFGLFYFDDFAVNDVNGLEDNSWCGEGRILAIRPNANGDFSQLNGSDGNQVDNFALVDEIPSDGDGTYVWSDTVDALDLYNLQSPSLPENSVIKRVWVEARAKDPDAGDIALPIKAGATQDDGSIKSLVTSYARVIGDYYLTNPDDGEPWEESDLVSLQIGVKIKS